MGQDKLCGRSLEALKKIEKNVDEIKDRCTEMKTLFSDVKNFPYIEYLTGYTNNLEKLKDEIITINSKLLTIHTGAATQKQIANQKKK